MLRHIAIKNFRGFHSLNTPEPLQPVTVLLGPNGSGKTTVLHAIRLSCQAMSLALESDSQVRTLSSGEIEVTKNTLVSSPAQLLPLADWQALFVDQQVSQGSSFFIDLTFDHADPIQSLHLEMSYARNQQLKFTLKVHSTQALARIKGMSGVAKISAALSQWLAEHAPRAVFIPPFYGVVKDEEYRPRVVVDRLVGSGDQSHVVRNLITSLTGQQLTQLNAFLDDMLGARISYRTSGDRVEEESPLRVEFRDSNGAIEISAAGAGLINLLALYASLARWQSDAQSGVVMFLLDEPEAHLHPRLQGTVAMRLASLVTQEFNAQLLMATHSVEIINRLGDTDFTTLLRTDRTATPSATALKGQVDILDDLSEWADLTPFTSINFMASRRVLFHEGPSDAKVLQRCAELRFRQQADKRRLFDRWARVQLHGSGNEKMVGLLQRLLKSPVWTQTAAADSFKLAMLLDRDYVREPGWRIEPAGEQPEIARLVWEQHSIESLFISETILSHWIKAFAGTCAPPNLVALLREAIALANQDAGLRDDTVDQMVLNLRKQPLSDKNGKPLSPHTDSHLNYCMKLARERYDSAPHVYQRGKDRAAFVLSKIKPELDLPRRKQFPVDVIALLERADLNSIPDPLAAIPHEISTLLDWLTDA